jgi:uncharacterized protein (TIGR03083 family)
VNIDEHIAILQREGELLAAAAARTSLDAVVPTCPGWTVRDLVRHISGIHFWARTIVSEARSRPFDPYQELESNWPEDDALIDWFAAGHAALVQTLRSAPSDLQCFAFLPAASPKAFWARRQAHETGMHRSDAESASGSLTPYVPEQAVDGIDELLLAFLARPGQNLKREAPGSLALQATDVHASWLVRISRDEPVAAREDATATADCRVSASASDLFRLVWNRCSTTDLDIAGDASLLDLWREAVTIHWR